MAVLNYQHLLEQAEKLIAPPIAGPPRQVDLRRAISSSYYAVFHFLTTTAADEIVGVTKRTTRRYALVYRSVNHRGLKEFCSEAKKPTPKSVYQRYIPVSGFGANIQAFASAVSELQEKRHAADYDPSNRVKTADAKVAIDTARSAIDRFEKASQTRRKSFIFLMLFSPRPN